MFIKAASVHDVAPGGAIAVKLNGIDIALCNVAGKFYAVSKACGHEGAPLTKGTLFGHIITCPLHFAQFDVRDGKALLGPCPRDYGKANPAQPGTPMAAVKGTDDLRTFPVRVENDDVLVDV